MSVHFDELQKQVRFLTDREKADLARQLITDLDGSSDPNADALWIEEATRRYRAFLDNELDALPGDEVMSRVRKQIT